MYRSTNSYTSSTLSDMSNAIKIEIDQILQVNSKIKNSSICNSDKINTVNRNNLKELKSQINLNEHNVYLKKMQKRMKSSVDILRYEIKEAREKILKTDKNFIGISLMKNNCKNSIIEQTVPEQFVIIIFVFHQIIHQKYLKPMMNWEYCSHNISNFKLSCVKESIVL